MKNEHRVSFVIASRNENPDTIDATVQGILATTYYGNWREVIVVDDCSDQRYSYQHPNVVVLRNPEPLGACRSRRRGCAAAAGDVLVSLDAHMSFAPGWLEEMLKYVDTGALLTPPWMNYRQSSVYHWGCRFGWQGHRDNKVSQIAGLQYIGLYEPAIMKPILDVPMVIGACYVMRKDAYEAIGGWNPLYSIYGSEEQDISARSWLLGNGVKCVTGARVGHLDRDTTNITPFEIQRKHFEHNQAVMIKSLFEPETTRILEDFIEPMSLEVKESLAKVDIEGWRDLIQRRRRMSDAEFFKRFLKSESPLVFQRGRPQLKKSELPNGLVHRAVLAEEEVLWEQRKQFESRKGPVTRAKGAVRGATRSPPGLFSDIPLPSELESVLWRGSCAIEAFDMTVGFQVDDPDFLKSIGRGWAHNWRYTSASKVDLLYSVTRRDSKIHVYAGNGFAGEIEAATQLPALIAGSLRFELLERAAGYVFVDAAVVGWRGLAILLLGDRWSGRSALLLELLRAGASYYSHAFAAIDGQGRVVPFAQPIGLVGPDGKPGREWPECTLDFGASPINIGLIADLPLKPGAVGKPRAVSRAQMIKMLFSQTLNARRLGLDAFQTLRRAVVDARAVSGPRAEKGAAAADLLRRMDALVERHSAVHHQADDIRPEVSGAQHSISRQGAH